MDRRPLIVLTYTAGEKSPAVERWAWFARWRGGAWFRLRWVAAAELTDGAGMFGGLYVCVVRPPYEEQLR